jgi:UDP-N-acetylglucosamine 2-epimerase (non-hydrolysing)
LATGQHRELLDQTLAAFDIVPDLDLNIMQPEQSLAELTSRLLLGLDAALAKEKPDLVLAQGDTTTVLCTALASFYRHVPFGHVEAGLRTGNLCSPFPEEANRVIAGRLAALHFAPTENARENLLAAGVHPETIHLVGNPVIDAVLIAKSRRPELRIPLDRHKRLILVTVHRRENFGGPIRDICDAVARIVKTFKDVQVLWPVHPNANVWPTVLERLGNVPGVHLCQPLEYDQCVAAMDRSYLVLTDSGGLQEEAPALGKPVLVLRRNTERPEAIKAGVAKLVGTDPENIFTSARHLLEDPQAWLAMSRGSNPFGDGHAAERIANVVNDFLRSLAPRPRRRKSARKFSSPVFESLE